MEPIRSTRIAPARLAGGGLVLCLVPVVMVLIFGVAPTEGTMGDVQRIFYLHVSVAWCGLLGCLGMGACGILYIARRSLAWDHWSQAAAEAGWLCVTLTLVTGSFWAHEAWGVWWTWEPRLTSSLVLWLIFTGIFLVRTGIDEPHRRARISGVLAILALGDLPLVVMATRWFRGVHPVAPELDAPMRFVLVAAVIGFTAFFGFLTWQRQFQLELSERTAALESAVEIA